MGVCAGGFLVWLRMEEISLHHGLPELGYKGLPEEGCCSGAQLVGASRDDLRQQPQAEVLSEDVRVCGGEDNGRRSLEECPCYMRLAPQAP